MEKLSKKQVSGMVSQQLPEIDGVVHSLRSLRDMVPDTSLAPEYFDDLKNSHHFSVTQTRRLKTLLQRRQALALPTTPTTQKSAALTLDALEAELIRTPWSPQ